MCFSIDNQMSYYGLPFSPYDGLIIKTLLYACHNKDFSSILQTWSRCVFSPDCVLYLRLQGKKVATLPTLGKEWSITFDLQLSEMPKDNAWVHFYFLSLTPRDLPLSLLCFVGGWAFFWLRVPRGTRKIGKKLEADFPGCFTTARTKNSWWSISSGKRKIIWKSKTASWLSTNQQVSRFLKKWRMESWCTR